MKKCLASIATMFLFSNPVLSQSYDLLTRADSGDAFAQMMLGDMFAAGDGVAQDHAEAARWYRLAAHRGAAKAQLSLGLLYSQGQGVEKNLERAYQWVYTAAAKGEVGAAQARDQIAGQLDAETIESLQQLAIRCIESNYLQCGNG